MRRRHPGSHAPAPAPAELARMTQLAPRPKRPGCRAQRSLHFVASAPALAARRHHEQLARAHLLTRCAAAGVLAPGFSFVASSGQTTHNSSAQAAHQHRGCNTAGGRALRAHSLRLPRACTVPALRPVHTVRMSTGAPAHHPPPHMHCSQSGTGRAAGRPRRGGTSHRTSRPRSIGCTTSTVSSVSCGVRVGERWIPGVADLIEGSSSYRMACAGRHGRGDPPRLPRGERPLRFALFSCVCVCVTRSLAPPRVGAQHGAGNAA